jgi:hypothetical protein
MLCHGILQSAHAALLPITASIGSALWQVNPDRSILTRQHCSRPGLHGMHILVLLVPVSVRLFEAMHAIYVCLPLVRPAALVLSLYCRA